MPTTAIYPARVTHLHRVPQPLYAEHRSYFWYVDLDDLPRLPRWLRPFAGFQAADHLDGFAGDTLRERVNSFLARNSVFLPGGRVTALLMPRVLGSAFSPLSLFWCHDARGELRGVIAEVRDTGGAREAYLLPPAEDGSVAVRTSHGVYSVRVPRPGEHLDLAVSLHARDDDARPALVATWRGAARRASAWRVLLLQFSSPLAPQTAALSLRFQAAMLRLHNGAATPARRGRAAARPRSVTGRGWAPSWVPS